MLCIYIKKNQNSTDPTRPDFVLPFTDTDTDFFPPGRTDTETDTDFFNQRVPISIPIPKKIPGAVPIPIPKTTLGPVPIPTENPLPVDH